MKKLVSLTLALMLITLVACSSDAGDTKSSLVTDPLGDWNRLVEEGKTTEDMVVNGDMVVGEGPLGPGVYDMEVLSLNGHVANLKGTRQEGYDMPLRYIITVPENSPTYPSKLRLILFKGDTLNFNKEATVKFTAVPKKVDMTNELGIGHFIVGRDIQAGHYKLDTNVALDPTYGSLGWQVYHYSAETGEESDYELNPDNPNVDLDIKDGDVITTILDTDSEETAANDAKLIFNQVQ